MRTVILSIAVVLAGRGVIALAPFAQAESPPAAATPAAIDFDRDIRPLFSDTCYVCHGPDAAERKSELRLDTMAGAFEEHDGQRVITPGAPQQSELIKRLTSTDPDLRMPPPDSGRQLTEQQISLINRWIEQGAVWKKHWSLVPPVRPAIPATKTAGWIRNDVDAFILARLEREGLAPSAEAAKETLIRRATLDLTGLPPTPREIDEFLADTSADAYEKLVDRLLASPRYGERMVLEWLDAARYSDSNGYQTDGTRAMWPWRDWVIAALNNNMPFDQFTLEQIAGDMLPNATVEQKIASGFNRNHMLNGEGGRIAEESRVEYVVDRVDTTSTIWLGLTAGCARCHDHKYDPLSQREFYGLYAYFNNVNEVGGVDRRNGTANPIIELPTDEQKAQIAALNTRIAELDAKVKSAETAEADRAKLQQELDAAKQQLDAANKAVLITMIMEERPELRETFILQRGLYDKPGEKVTAAIPASLHPLPADAPNNRLGFARWLIDRANPLTARVTVNRYWQVFFGTGLVKTTEDFGSQGERPSHPELLDWLADDFARDWNVKRMHRLLLTSATYRQSSQATPALLERDPENRLLARAARYRLPSFVIRDQALSLAGLLVEKQGGPPVKPYQPEGIWEDFSFGQIKYQPDTGSSLYRRSLYVFWRRSVGPTTMFDTSARQVCMVRQPRTNSPLHALITLNDVAYVEAARAFAQRTIREGGDTPESRLAWAFRQATSRQPKPAELQVLVQGYQRALATYQADAEAAKQLIAAGQSPRDETLNPAEHAAYTAVASVILNLDETLTKE